MVNKLLRETARHLNPHSYIDYLIKEIDFKTTFGLPDLSKNA